MRTQEQKEKDKAYYAKNKERKLIAQRARGLVYYQKNKKRVVASTAAANSKRRVERAALVNALKLDAGCFRCGYDKCAAALHFHHRDPATKSVLSVTRLLTASIKRIQVEIDKCDVLCANCHAETHAYR